MKEKDKTTEDKIKIAAKKVFQEKGYAGARTRDIAEEAGINLALLNYYYRSKEKLFELIVEESFKQFFPNLQNTIDDPDTSIEYKITVVVNHYMDLLHENPNLPLFILGTFHSQPDYLFKVTGLPKSFMIKSAFYQQLEEALAQSGQKNINPLHIIVNILSLSIFPIVAKPMLKTLTDIEEDKLYRFIEERRVLIPLWLKDMFKL